ncbi:MAG: prenyltransferase/squalene oxidase repeat-containing protein [Planctomycetota bacterium]
MQAAELAAGYLISNQKKDGSFIYVNHPEIEKQGSKYNILRHAGTIYALASYGRDFPSEKLTQCIIRSAGYLQKNISFFAPDKCAVFSHWSESRKYRTLQAKLGGAGLALISLIHAEKVRTGLTSSETLNGLAEFILFMQEGDGSFYSKYIKGTGKDKRFISLYYPGEAMLGLMLLYESDNNDRWFRAAVRGMLYLAETRKKSGYYPADHWALLATEKIIKNWKKIKNYTAKDRQEILEHAAAVAGKLKERQLLEFKNKVLFGSYLADGRVCPAATRLEGLLALAVTPGIDENFRKEITASCAAGIEFILNSQLTRGRFAGGFPRAVIKKNSSSADDTSFNFRADEIRIDYVQHSLSAIMQYYYLAQDRGEYE